MVIFSHYVETYKQNDDVIFFETTVTLLEVPQTYTVALNWAVLFRVIYFQIFNIISYKYFFTQMYCWNSFTKHTNYLGEIKYYILSTNMLTMVLNCPFVLKIFNNVLETILNKNHCQVKSINNRLEKKKIYWFFCRPRVRYYWRRMIWELKSNSFILVLYIKYNLIILETRKCLESMRV